jgi:hypothetical protein
VRDQSRKSIVIAETNFVIGNRIVLIDNRHNPEFKQSIECASRLQILPAINEIERRKQDLTANKRVSIKCFGIHAHQSRLPNGRNCLQRLRVAGSLISTEPKSRKTSTNSARRDDHDPVTRLTSSSYLKAEFLDRVSTDDSLVISER